LMFVDLCVCVFGGGGGYLCRLPFELWNPLDYSYKTSYVRHTCQWNPQHLCMLWFPAVGNNSTANAKTSEVGDDVECTLLTRVELTQAPFLE